MSLPTSLYRRPEWKTLRQEAIDLVEGECENCGKSQESGAILQLHHKGYVRGRKPWEYSLSEFLVVCKGCHAEIHGRIKCRSNWLYEGEDDLGDLIGTCEYCGNDIRHEHYISHPTWGSLTVGTDCADTLTQSKEATERRKLLERKKRFLKSPRWNNLTAQTESITQSGFHIVLTHGSKGYQLKINGILGKQALKTSQDAKSLLFEKIVNGDIAKFFATKKRLR